MPIKNQTFDRCLCNIRHKLSFSLCLLLGLVLSSCEEKENESELNVSPSVIDIVVTGGTGTFEITSNTAWTVSCDESKVEIAPTRGAGNHSVNVTLPASNSMEQHEYKVLVKTDDGRIQKNVTIKQDGRFIDGDITLQVTNYADVVLFGGKGHTLDSLRVLSNVPWQVKGPDWIEAWNGERWVTLSQDRATIQEGETTGQDAEGTKILYLRTVADNNSEADLLDNITITPTYDDADVKVERIAYQLGKYSVQPNIAIALADGICMDWEVGTDVKYYIVHLSDRQFSDSELNDDNISNWDICDVGTLTSWDNLNENTLYYLYMIGVDANGNGHTMYETGFKTGTSVGQALVFMDDIKYEDGKWIWATRMNEYCKGYYMWVCTNSTYFTYNRPTLAWFMNDMTHDEKQLNEYFDLKYADDIYSIVTDLHILLVTWGAGQNSNYHSYLINRFCSYDYEESAARSYSPELGATHFETVPLDRKNYRNSFVRIKK